MKLAAPVLCAVLAGLSSFAQDEPPKGSISGTVMRSDTGTPKADVDVCLDSSSDLYRLSTRVTVSNSSGRFEFTELDPETYRIAARRRRFAMLSHTLQEQGFTVTLGKNEKVTDVVLTLIPGGVITGKVVDDLGEPVAGASVKLLSRSYDPAATTYKKMDSGDTNDLGDFRIYGIPAGTYYLEVTPPSGETDQAALDNKSREARGSTYRRIFYDGVTSASEAMTVRITPGNEFVANFRISKVKTATLHLSLSAPRKYAGASGYIGMVPADSTMLEGLVYSEIRHDPSLTFSSIVPGDYFVGGVLELKEEDSGAGAIGIELMHIEEGETDAQVRVNLFEAKVKGHVTFDTATHPDVSALKLKLLPLRGQVFILDEFKGEDATVNEKGEFNVSTRSALRLAIRLEPGAAGFENYYLTSVLVGGEEALTTGIVTSARRAQVRLLVAGDGGTISGRVVDPKGKAVGSSTVVALPDAEHRRTYSCIGAQRTDYAGRFTMRGLCPGHYDVLALPPELADGIYWDPEFVRMHIDQAVPLTVMPSGRYVLELRSIQVVDQ